MNAAEKMELTLNLAKEAMEVGECPIAAMIFLDDKIIAESYTSENTDKRLLVHAELKALIKVDKSGYSFADRNRMQLFTNLEPCLMCMGAVMSSFVGQVYYALESPSDGAVEMVKNWNPLSDDFLAYTTPEIYGGVLREKSQQLFKEYSNACKAGFIKDWAESLARL